MQPFKTIRSVNVPSIGLGTWDLRGHACEKAVASALNVGYRHIDTAEMYDNEEFVGAGVKNSGIPRDDIFITTKVWPTHYGKDAFFKAVDTSLKKLKMDQVDLLLLHWPKDDETNIKATEYLLQCHEQKLAKQIGVSNFSIAQLKQAQSQAPIFCNQVKYHPYEKKRELLKYAQDQDVLLTAYSPLGSGDLKDDARLKSIGEKYGKSAIQIALRWLIQQPQMVTIPKAGTEAHQKANLDIFDFELTEEEMAIF